jgi:hypothetical protein
MEDSPLHNKRAAVRFAAPIVYFSRRRKRWGLKALQAKEVTAVIMIAARMMCSALPGNHRASEYTRQNLSRRAGPLAGIAGMPFPRFFLANVAGAAVYIPLTVAFGYAVNNQAKDMNFICLPSRWDWPFSLKERALFP